MKITEEFLREHYACAEGINWFISNGETAHEEVINRLVAEKKYDWADWLIYRLLPSGKHYLQACFARECILHRYRGIYFDDDAQIAEALTIMNSPLWNPDRVARWNNIKKTLREPIIQHGMMLLRDWEASNA